MKTIHTGDWHIGINRNDVFFGKTQNDLIFNSMTQIIKYAVDNGIEAIFVQGDIFHRNRPTPEDELIFTKWLESCRKLKLRVYIFEGNHECNEYAASALAPFSARYENDEYINFIDEPVHLGGWFEKVRFIVVPHIAQKHLESNESVRDRLRVSIEPRLASDKPNVVLGHFHSTGSLIGSESFLLANTANTYDLGLTEGIELSILSHIHKHQYNSFQRTLLPGSIVCCDFGERNEAKGFVVLDHDTLKWQFVELDIVRWKQIELKLETKAQIKQLDEKLKKVKKAAEGKVLKLIVNYSDATRSLIDFKAIESSLVGCHVKNFIKRKKESDEQHVEVRQINKITPQKATEIWLRETFEDEQGIDKTIELGNQILSEVL